MNDAAKGGGRATAEQPESGLEPIELAREIARLVESKLGSEIVGIDVGDLVAYTDYLVIATARNERQAKAIVDEVQLQLKRRHGRLAARVEGSGDAGWLLLDYVDAVLHVFDPEARERYRLESLWGDATRVELNLAEDGSDQDPDPH